MKEPDCEQVLMAKMAELDGENSSLIGDETVRLHLEQCAGCSLGLAQMRVVGEVMAGSTRAAVEADLWPAVSSSIGVGERSPIDWVPFAIAGVLLVFYKLAELLPERDPGQLLRVAPLIVVALLFIMIRQNPFKVVTELVPEK